MHWFLLILIFVGGELSWAKTVEGPAIGFEIGERRRVDADIFYPINLESLKLTFIPMYGLNYELRDKEDDLSENMMVMSLGLASIIKFTNVELIGMFTDYKSFRSGESHSQMLEGIGGVNLPNRGLTFLIRYRDFPHASRWLPMVFYHFSFGNYEFAIDIPSKITVSRDFRNRDIAVFGGIKLESTNYPLDIGFDDPWAEGHSRTVFGGVRYRLHGALFIETRAGLWAESVKIYDRDDELDKISSKFTPWFRVALQTIVHK